MAVSIKQAFYNQLNDNQIIDTEMIIDFEVILDQLIVNWEYREFKNIIFKEKVIIKNAQLVLVCDECLLKLKDKM